MHTGNRPIFIVGMPRSGSTFFQGVVALHPDLCTTTRATRDFPTSPFLCRLARLVGKQDEPGEGGPIWDRYRHREHDHLNADDVTPAAKRYYQAVVRTHVTLYGRPRFLARYPANSLRIGFFASIFPDALFVHLVRDPRAVCQSVLRMRERDGSLAEWWGVQPPGWRAWEELPPCEGVAHQWTAVVKTVRESGRELGPSRYTEIRYEDLMVHPVGRLREFCAFAGLPWNEAVAAYCEENVESRNDKWTSSFTSQELDAMTRIFGPTMRQFGYRDPLRRATS